MKLFQIGQRSEIFFRKTIKLKRIKKVQKGKKTATCLFQLKKETVFESMPIFEGILVWI